MSYVVGAWAACGVLLALYALRTLRRGRALRRALGDDQWN
ncbi:MAG TPA: heme exporter protein CcmD [Acidimicrobiales bacterium]|nr:heme exporter protein CcmD [Acidimicrobiales bacterium]